MATEAVATATAGLVVAGSAREAVATATEAAATATAGLVVAGSAREAVAMAATVAGLAKGMQPKMKS